MRNLYMGWDSRQSLAYNVMEWSLYNHSKDINVLPLKINDLRSQGIYTRPDDLLSATEFTFTRYLVPYLHDYKGWATFIDSDMLMLTDINPLLDQADDDYAIMVAKPNYDFEEGLKMDGQKKFRYPMLPDGTTRKNWSSLIMFNCAHPSNRVLTPDLVNNLDYNGIWFHQFQWLCEWEIGEFDIEWNWLINVHEEPRDGSPKILHYTDGGPWFPQHKNGLYAKEWFSALDSFENGLNISLSEVG